MIVISGADGYIGQNLLKSLIEKKIGAIGLVRNLHRKAIEDRLPIPLDFYREYYECPKDIDCLVHLAANPLTDLSKTTLDKILQDNIALTALLLEHRPKKFVYVSSATVYGPNTVPMTEESLCYPQSVYGATKLSCEHLVRTFCNYHDIEYAIARLCAVCGGVGNTHGVLYDQYRKHLQEDPVEVIGRPPGSRKPYLYIDDAVSGLTHLILSESVSKEYWPCYNICTSQSISIQEILDEFKVYFGPREYKWVDTWKGDDLVVKLNNDKMFNEFGWKPISSIEAIRKTLNDYARN